MPKIRTLYFSVYDCAEGCDPVFVCGDYETGVVKNGKSYIHGFKVHSRLEFPAPLKDKIKYIAEAIKRKMHG